MSDRTPISFLRRLVVIPVALLFAGMLAGLHLYLARRIVFAPAWPEPIQTALTGLIIVLGSLLFIAPIAERFLKPDQAKF